MSPKKAELEAENRRLRRVVGEVYDRVAEHLELPTDEHELRDDEGDDDEEDEDEEE